MIDRFPDPEVARGAGGALGFRVAPKAAVVQCVNERRNCRIVGEEKGIVGLSGYATVNDTVALRFTISRPVRYRDGISELRAALREIRLILVDGRWRVTGDQALVIS